MSTRRLADMYLKSSRPTSLSCDNNLMPGSFSHFVGGYLRAVFGEFHSRPFRPKDKELVRGDPPQSKRRTNSPSWFPLPRQLFSFIIFDWENSCHRGRDHEERVPLAAVSFLTLGGYPVASGTTHNKSQEMAARGDR